MNTIRNNILRNFTQIPNNLINDSKISDRTRFLFVYMAYQPEFFNWAFNRERGKDIKRHWDLIPNDTDILITHGPPYKIFDKTIRGVNVGCEELRKKVLEVNPLLNVFGHIHEDYGCYKDGKTTFVNASLLNHRYYFTNDPVIIDLVNERSSVISKS